MLNQAKHEKHDVCFVLIWSDMISVHEWSNDWYMYIYINDHDMMTNVFRGSQRCFIYMYCTACVCIDSHSLSGDPFILHWAVSSPPNRCSVSCRFLSLTQGTGSPADQFQTLLLRTKNTVLWHKLCMYKFWMNNVVYVFYYDLKGSF